MGEISLKQHMEDLNAYLTYAEQTGIAANTTLHKMLEDIYDAYVKENSVSIFENTFIECEEKDVPEVFSMLHALGFSTRNVLNPNWVPGCAGVVVYGDKTFQCFFENNSLPLLHLNEFRAKFLSLMDF